MGSISGFKEYVDKDHPACPLCGGATNKASNPFKGEKLNRLWHLEHGGTRECVNCGAQNKDGKILRDSN